MKAIKLLLPTLFLLGLVTSLSGHAAPRALTSELQLRPSKITYPFFTIDPNKFNAGDSIRSVTDWLTANLPAGYAPCVVAGDLNVTNMTCASGGIRFGTDFFTHNFDSILPNALSLFPDPKSVPKSVGITEGVNFATPTVVGTPAPSRIPQFRFGTRIAQFAMWIDPRVLDGADQGGLEIIVNRQTVRIGPLAAGAPAFVGVEDPHGFTEITLVPYGSNQAWIANYFSIVPLANF